MRSRISEAEKAAGSDAGRFRTVGGADFSALITWQVLTGVLLVPDACLRLDPPRGTF